MGEPELVFHYSAFLQCTKAKYAFLFRSLLNFSSQNVYSFMRVSVGSFHQSTDRTKMSALEHALQAIFWFMGLCGGGSWPDDKKSLNIVMCKCASSIHKPNQNALQAIFWFMGLCGGGNWPDDKKSLNV